MPIRNDWIRHLKIKNSIIGKPIISLLIHTNCWFINRRVQSLSNKENWSSRNWNIILLCQNGKINNINYIIKIHLHKIKSKLWILKNRECVSNSARHSMRDMPKVLKTPIKLQHSILRNRDQRVPEKIWWQCDPHLFLQTEIIIALELTIWI